VVQDNKNDADGPCRRLRRPRSQFRATTSPHGLIRDTHAEASDITKRADRLDMRWLPRLFGLALLFGLLAWSFSYSLDRLDRISDGAAASAGTAEESEVLESSAGNNTPEYLAFVGGIPSGAYAVADLPDSRDWDYGERGGRAPEAPSISEDNPVNYNVEVEDGPYVTAADATEDDSTADDEPNADEQDDESTLPSIKPGLYATQFGMDRCEYELRRIMDDNRDHVIGHDQLIQGRMLVSINEYEPDSFVATESCGEWSPWSPLVEPLTVAGDGDYWVGDLEIGFWDVPRGCLWEKVTSFRGAQLADVEASGVGPGELSIDQFTIGVRVRHCSAIPMSLSDKPLPPQVQIADLEAAKEAAHSRPYVADREVSGREARRIERRRR